MSGTFAGLSGKSSLRLWNVSKKIQQGHRQLKKSDKVCGYIKEDSF
jgi:hypothetical protein